MALCPFAVHRIIPHGKSDPPINARLAILHVAVYGGASLHDYFRYRSGGIESHFYIDYAGRIEQYRDTRVQADANYIANDFAVSIETAGFEHGTWNAAQLTSIKRLLMWLSVADGIPLRKADSAYGSGVGYHVQFGAPGVWTNVAKTCPGPDRIKQFHNELVPWMGTGESKEAGGVSKQDVIDALNEQAVLNKIANAVWRRDLGGGDNRQPASLHMLWASNASRAAKNLLPVNEEKLAQRLAAKLGGSASAAQVKRALRDVLLEGVADDE